jgi:hypothetical protein
MMAAWWRESVGGETAAATPWVRQGCDGRCLRAVGVVWTRSARGSDRAADGGPHAGLIFFQFNQNELKLGIRKRTHYRAPKIPKFCMLVDWGTMNNSLNCSGIQIST